jgi:hypothetical protein
MLKKFINAETWSTVVFWRDFDLSKEAWEKSLWTTIEGSVSLIEADDPKKKKAEKKEAKKEEALDSKKEE